MQKYPESSKNGKATGQSRIDYFGQKYLEEILRNNYFLTILEYFRKPAKQQMRKKSKLVQTKNFIKPKFCQRGCSTCTRLGWGGGRMAPPAQFFESGQI